MSAPHLPPVGPATASDVYTQSQETTVSTLTAFTSIVDSSVVGEEEDPELPPLTSIFHRSMIVIGHAIGGIISQLKWLVSL